MVRKIGICLGVVVTLFGAALSASAQPASDYTKDLPSVQRVESQIKGADPTDTTARQVAVFTYLQSYIQRIKLARDYRGAYSPGEQKLMGDYSLAAYQLTQDFTKSHSPAEVKAFQQKEGQYEVNNAMDWIKSLQGQQAADTYRGTEASLAQSYKQHEDKVQQEMKPSSGGDGIAGDAVLDPTGAIARGEANRVNDPKLRRCLELGSPLDDCEGLGAVEGFASLMTMGTAKVDDDAPPVVSGVVLAGLYQGAGGQSGVSTGIGDGRAVVTDCGGLYGDPRDYRVRKTGGVTQLIIANDPQPIVVTVQPDGSLMGPGTILVSGRVITGYSTQTTQVMVNGAPAGVQGYDCGGPCQHVSQTPIFAPKVARCTFGVMTAVHTKPAQPTKTGLGMLDAMNETKPLVNGLRMTGRFAGPSGLKLDFANGDVTLDCGQAHVSMPYVVENTPAGFVIHVQNGGGAFLLAVAPDDTLHGSGSTSVNGRLVTAINGDNVRFAPHSETCAVGGLTSAAGRNTMSLAGR